MSNPITAEELFGIIPVDEEDPKDLDALFTEKKAEIDAIETRGSRDFYENQREREDGI